MTRRILLSLLLLMSGTGPLFAQKGLQIAALFDGRYRDRTDAVEVHYEGRRLRKYRLTLFRSLTLTPTPQEVRSIEKMVQADGARAEVKEVARGNRLYYGFYQMPGPAGGHRYVFYRNDALRLRPHGKLTLIYMEGTASLEDLKRAFSK